MFWHAVLLAGVAYNQVSRHFPISLNGQRKSDGLFRVAPEWPPRSPITEGCSLLFFTITIRYLLLHTGGAKNFL